MQTLKPKSNHFEHFLEVLIFSCRWLQAPLYVGLIVAQCVYVYKFGAELWHLVHEASTLAESDIMLIVLGLIDVVMVANLLVMVIIGGYETFVSRIHHIEGHPDQPEWLSHINAGVLKIKLATALIGISAIHLLKTFINFQQVGLNAAIAQVGIHLVFVVSALAMAYTDKVMNQSIILGRQGHNNDPH